MMRLDKLLAHTGYGTRKEVKQLLKEKRVTVNGKIETKDKRQIDEFHDEITVDGEVLTFVKNHFIMLNKPQGVVSAVSDDRDPTVMDCIDVYMGTDMFPVGRLDKDTQGLLIICNDGKLAHRLLSPKHHVDKCYEVHLAECIKEEDIKRLQEGIALSDFIAKPAIVEVVDERCILLTIQEGKFHQVKRMMHAIKNEVVALKRLRFGPLVLDETLAPGEWRYLEEAEVQQLYEIH